MEFTPDGKQLILGRSSAQGMGPTVQFWDVETGTVAREFQIEETFQEQLEMPHVGVASDGVLIAIAAGNKLILVDTGSLEVQQRLHGHTKAIRSISFAPGRPLLATCSDDKTVRLWSTATGEQLAVRELPEFGQHVSFSPDGAILAVASGFESPRLWDVADLMERP
jgi:WD40 repeat protein